VRFQFERNRISLGGVTTLVEEGSRLGSAGENQRALAAFQAAALLDPHDPQPPYLAGLALLELGRYADAVASYDTTDRLAPGWFHCRADRWMAAELAAGRVSPETFRAVRALEDGNAPPDEMQLMMRALLAERFKLATHHESRELAIYALVLARSDGKLGPQLRPSTLDCTNASGARGLRVSPSATILGGPPTCRMTMAVGRLIAGGMTIAQLLSTLSGLAGRTVMDRTGLTGTFDVDLAWIPEPGEGLWLGEQRLSPRDVAPGAAPPPPSDGASIFTALQEQLGLKLDSSKAPMEVLVIDRLEQPTED
jgi:uncharacterized protein (TIGR03435 family)